MKITSAYANKMLKQLEEEKEYWNGKERDFSSYVCAEGETPVIPEYDYTEVSKTLDAINEKIVIIKHLLNVQNVNARIQVGDRVMSVDEILISMAQLSRRKTILDGMRRRLPKERLQLRTMASNRNQVPEYLYANYDPEEVKRDFERVDRMIMEMQIALDHHNQTELFEVPID